MLKYSDFQNNLVKGMGKSIGEKLKIARKRMNFIQSQVSAQTGIGESSLSEFENNKRTPSLKELKLLADTYKQPITFFLSDVEERIEPVLWRAKPSHDFEKTEANFLMLCERYSNLERWCDDFREQILPSVRTNPDTFSYQYTENLANKVRVILQLGDYPGHELLSVLEEKCGVKIFQKPFNDNGSALSIKSEIYGLAMFINASEPRWRRNFDIAHELFHLLTWDTFRLSQNNVGTEREESLANCFAANLLMPYDSVMASVNEFATGNKLSLSSLFEIARLFDVSIEALLWRLHYVFRLGSKNEDFTKNLIDKARSELLPENKRRENTSPPKWPERYKSLAIKALNTGKLSLGKFAEYLEISRSEAQEYLMQEDELSEEISIPSP